MRGGLAERQELSGHNPVATAMAMHHADAVRLLADRGQHVDDTAGAEALYRPQTSVTPER